MTEDRNGDRPGTGAGDPVSDTGGKPDRVTSGIPTPAKSPDSRPGKDEATKPMEETKSRDTTEPVEETKSRDTTKPMEGTKSKKERAVVRDTDTKDAGAGETVEIVEETIRSKIKPVLDPAIRECLDRKNAHRVPEFRRQEWFRYRRLGESWRKPRGLHSKMRKNLKYRPPKVRTGFRTPALVRGYHPSGFREITVHTVGDLDAVDPGTEAVRIGGTVGNRKRAAIIERADSLRIRVLNRRGL